MSHNHPIPLDWVPAGDREELIEYFACIFSNVSVDYGSDRVRITRPVFLCNTITPFHPTPFIFEIYYKSETVVCINVISEEINGKFKRIKSDYPPSIPINEFKQAIKNLVFVPLYIPDNCSYYPL
jgi:hypothetical protein